MSKALVFAAGIVTGIAATPAIIVYVRPVQKVLVRVFAKLYTFAIEQEGSDFREKLVEVRDHINEFLDDYPEDPKFEPLKSV